MESSNLPLVSVIIPAYNHEKYITETINSIISSTYKNIELLVIDDGSKDSTFKVLQSLKEQCDKRFKNVIFETQENQGLCTTLNKLNSYAKGEYVYLIASDDVVKPQAIEKEVEFLVANPDYVLVVGDNELIDGDSKRIGWDKHQNTMPLKKAKYKSNAEYLKANYKHINFNTDEFGLYKNFCLRNYVPNGYLLRKAAIDKIGGYAKDDLLEDWYRNLQLSKIGKFKYIDEILLSYRWHDNNTVKRQEYMRNISAKTKKYEYEIVCRKGNEKFREIFEKEVFTKKVKLNLGFIKYYKQIDLDGKHYICEIFGKKIKIKE